MNALRNSYKVRKSLILFPKVTPVSLLLSSVWVIDFSIPSLRCINLARSCCVCILSSSVYFPSPSNCISHSFFLMFFSMYASALSQNASLRLLIQSSYHFQSVPLHLPCTCHAFAVLVTVHLWIHCICFLLFSKLHCYQSISVDYY